MTKNLPEGGAGHGTASNADAGQAVRDDQSPNPISQEGLSPTHQIGRTLAFFASVIKSGEPWTGTCQADYDKAQAALSALSTPPATSPRGVSDRPPNYVNDLIDRLLEGTVWIDDATMVNEAATDQVMREAAVMLGVLAAPPLPTGSGEGLEPPWSDLKVAFDVDEIDPLWAAHDQGSLILPAGWELNETDGSGARYVAVFRVDHSPPQDESQQVADALAALSTPSVGGV